MTGFLRRALASAMLLFAAVFAAHAAPANQHAAASDKIFDGSVAMNGLLPVHVDRRDGRILITLPSPSADGVSLRLLSTAELDKRTDETTIAA